MTITEKEIKINNIPAIIWGNPYVTFRKSVSDFYLCKE